MLSFRRINYNQEKGKICNWNQRPFVCLLCYETWSQQPLVHCTLYTLHCTLNTVQLTLYYVIFTVYTAPYTLYTVHCTLYTLHLTLYTVYMYTVHSKVQTKKYRRRETLNLLTCADGSTKTKTNRNRQKCKINVYNYIYDLFHMSVIMCHISHFMCPMAHVTCHVSFVTCLLSSVTCHQCRQPHPQINPLQIPPLCTLYSRLVYKEQTPKFILNAKIFEIEKKLC